MNLRPADAGPPLLRTDTVLAAAAKAVDDTEFAAEKVELRISCKLC
jgi:hypothetical protein